jgi:CRISPR system Cascade subunit CasE
MKMLALESSTSLKVMVNATSDRVLWRDFFTGEEKHSMYLSRLEFNLTSKHALRDISDRYQLHATLESVFDGETARYLWRIFEGRKPYVLVQSLNHPKWERLEEKYPHYCDKLKIKNHGIYQRLKQGHTFTFLLEANPTVKHKGKRIGILSEGKQLSWLTWQGSKSGFSILHSKVLASKQLHLKKPSCNPQENASLTNPNFMSFQFVTFFGILIVEDAETLRQSMQSGIGRAKDFGAGLLLLTSAPKNAVKFNKH